MAAEIRGVKPNYEGLDKAAISLIDQYGLAVLSKSDRYSETFMRIESTPELQKRDFFGRAEALGITDQRYKGLMVRARMCHGDYQSPANDANC